MRAPIKVVASDEALVGRVRDGEASGQRELFRRERPKVTATLYRLLGPNSELEDLVQETFLQVARSLTSLRDDANVSAWIRKIAVHVAMRYLRQKRPACVPLELVAPVDGTPRQDRVIVAREGVRRLYNVLARLKPPARVAFALHVIEGHMISEVADLTGSSVVAVKVRISRARKQVRAMAARDPILSEYLDSSGDRGEAP